MKVTSKTIVTHKGVDPSRYYRFWVIQACEIVVESTGCISTRAQVSLVVSLRLVWPLDLMKTEPTIVIPPIAGSSSFVKYS